MEINKPFYVVDEDYLTLKDNAFTIVKGKDNIYIRNITGIQISFEHSFLPPEKEKPKSRTSSLIINGLLFYFVMLYIVLALFISFIFFKSLFVFLAMMLILPIIKFFYFEFEKLVQKNLETWNQKIKREFLENINATKVSEIELHCTMDKPMPGIVSSVLIAWLEVELKESGFQFERTERNSFIIKNPFFENSETNNSFISAPPPGYFGDKQPVRVVSA